MSRIVYIYIFIMYFVLVHVYLYLFLMQFSRLSYKCRTIKNLQHTHFKLVTFGHTLTRYKVKTNNNVESVDLIWTKLQQTIHVSNSWGTGAIWSWQKNVTKIRNTFFEETSFYWVLVAHWFRCDFVKHHSNSCQRTLLSVNEAEGDREREREQELERNSPLSHGGMWLFVLLWG